MTDTTTKVREHYSPTNLTNRIESALTTITPEEQTLTVAQLAPLDQFHIARHPRHRRIGRRRWARAIDPRAGSRLRHRRPGALSRRHLRL